jgi:hypothetical protein
VIAPAFVNASHIVFVVAFALATSSLIALEEVAVDLTPAPNGPDARLLRAKRSALFNSHHLPEIYKREMALDKEVGSAPLGYTDIKFHRLPLPEIPVAESTVIVTGVVRGIDPHLSEDKTVLYTEYTVDIEQVLHNVSGYLVNPTIAIVRHGFDRPVRMPSGRVVKTVAVGHGFALARNAKYVLFLRSVPDSVVYTPVKAWEVRDGKVFATAPEDLRRVNSDTTDFQGGDYDRFVESIRTRVAARD